MTTSAVKSHVNSEFVPFIVDFSETRFAVFVNLRDQ